MSTYIYATSAISTQNELLSTNIKRALSLVEKSKGLVEPNYQEFLKPMVLRRMNKVTKMSVACAFKCLNKVDYATPDAIIIGTGLGSVADTEKFLKISTITKSKLLPPTSFIQSGHNTIAGQIALLLKNDCYNMTHVQQSLSFEHALIDCKLSIFEGKQMVLVGAVDEFIPLISDIANRFKVAKEIRNQLSEGASFFLMGPDKLKAKVELKANSILNFTTISQAILLFLNDNHVDLSEIEMGFFGFNLNAKVEVKLPFKTLVYTNYCGRHFSSVAYGLHIATIYMRQSRAKYIIVANVATNNKIGLMLIKRV